MVCTTLMRWDDGSCIYFFSRQIILHQDQRGASEEYFLTAGSNTMTLFLQEEDLLSYVVCDNPLITHSCCHQRI